MDDIFYVFKILAPVIWKFITFLPLLSRDSRGRCKFKYYSDITGHFHRLNKYRHHSSCHIFTNFLGVRAYQMHPPTNLYDKTYCTENDHKRVSSIKEIADIFKRVHGKNLKQLSNKGIV